MAYRYTDGNTRAVYNPLTGLVGGTGRIAKFWYDAAGTQPVDLGLYSAAAPDTPGASTGSNQLEVQADGMWPAMWDRNDDQDHVWLQVGVPGYQGDLYRIFCDADQRIDDLAAAVEALQQPGAVDESAIADGAVTTPKLADDSVTAAKIAADAVGTSEIAANAVTSAEIAADAVGSSEIAAGAVGTAELADSAVTSGKIADGTIVDGDISDSAAIAQSKVSGLAAALAAKSDLTGYTLERAFSCSFPGAANEKIDLYFTGHVYACIEITLVGVYQTSNAGGVVRAVYSLSASSGGTIHENTQTYTIAQGNTPTHFGLTAASWDAANSRWKITLAHRTTTANTVSMVVRWQGNSTTYTNNIRDSIGISAVYTTDATAVSAPALPINPATTTALSVKQRDLGYYIATDPQWGYDGGQDIAVAANAAIAAMSSNGGRLIIPPTPAAYSTWLASERIILKTGVEIEGAGRGATKIRGNVEGVFGWSSHLSQWSIKNLRADSYAGHLMTTKGGDYSISQGEIDGCWFTSNDANGSVFYHDSIYDYIKVAVTNSRFDRATASTLPGWYVRNLIGALNGNIWKNLWVQSYNNVLAPFFHIESISTTSYTYDNDIRNIVGEQNCGGVVHLYNMLGGTLENIVDWDAQVDYAADLIRVTESTAAPDFRSRYVHIQSCGRRGGTLGSGVYDINLVPGKSKNCTVIAVNHSSEPTSGLRVNFSESDGHTLIGVPPQGAVWPTKPANVSHFFGNRAQFYTGLHVGTTLETSGTGSPEGVVTGSGGDRWLQTDGTIGSVLWVKESGAATTTGWVSKGQTLPKLARNSQYRHLLSGKPYPMTVGTGTWAKDNWRFMPISLDGPLTLAYLGTIWSTGATGGTAALIFALYGVDSAGKPTTLQTDYSSYGSLDMTTGVGTEQLLPTAGLVIPAGDWCLAAGWSGTATGSPVVYTTSGCHPRVAGNAISQNSSGWQQSVSGATAPSPAVAAAATVSGIAIYGVLG